MPFYFFLGRLRVPFLALPCVDPPLVFRPHFFFFFFFFCCFFSFPPFTVQPESLKPRFGVPPLASPFGLVFPLRPPELLHETPFCTFVSFLLPGGVPRSALVFVIGHPPTFPCLRQKCSGPFVPSWPESFLATTLLFFAFPFFQSTRTNSICRGAWFPSVPRFLGCAATVPRFLCLEPLSLFIPSFQFFLFFAFFFFLFRLRTYFIGTPLPLPYWTSFHRGPPPPPSPWILFVTPFFRFLPLTFFFPLTGDAHASSVRFFECGPFPLLTPLAVLPLPSPRPCVILCFFPGSMSSFLFI